MLTDRSNDVVNALIVDDMEVNISVLCSVLNLCSIKCDSARNGFEAIKKARDNNYDLIFMDYVMPDMDGAKAAEMIRSMNKRYAEIPIIAITGTLMADTEKKLLECGMNAYLTKPINKDILIETLKKWLPPDKITGEVQVHNCDNNKIEFTPALKLAEEIEGLDIKLGLSRIGGMQEAYERSLRILDSDIPLRCASLQGMLNDIERFEIEVHGLKGALAMGGHMILSEMAKELELAAKSRDINFCGERLPVFIKGLEEFGNKLNKIFFNNEINIKEKGTDRQLKKSVKKIKEATDDFDRTAALDELLKIKNLSFGKKTDEILTAVNTALERFDLDLAAELINLLDI